MNAYLNEQAFTPYPDRESARVGIMNLIECLKELDQFGIKNVKRSKLIDHKCLVRNESYLRMLNDKSLIDKDMKSVLINRMETLEPEDEIEDKYMVLSMKFNNKDCKGLGWASLELENTIALSFHSEIWERSYYNLIITHLNDDAEEYEVNTTTRNITSKGHIEIHRDFLSSLHNIPRNGKILVNTLVELFPNLIFSRSATIQLKKLRNEDVVAQVYSRLQDLQKTAAIYNEHCSSMSFSTKASPESDTREKLYSSQLTIQFEGNKSYLCSWHLRFTPGAGRIHFYHVPAEKKIYVGYIGDKIIS